MMKSGLCRLALASRHTRIQAEGKIKGEKSLRIDVFALQSIETT